MDIHLLGYASVTPPCTMQVINSSQHYKAKSIQKSWFLLIVGLAQFVIPAALLFDNHNDKQTYTTIDVVQEHTR